MDGQQEQDKGKTQEIEQADDDGMWMPRGVQRSDATPGILGTGGEEKDTLERSGTAS